MQAPAEMRPPALVARAIRKQYGGVQALDGADISIGHAEVHALLGENGAGKSTLVKVIAGLVRPEAGEVLVDGRPLVLESPNASRAAGIAVVYQELSLVPQLSVMHNIVLSDLPLRRGLFAPDRAMAIARESLERLGVPDINVKAPVSSLPLDHRQMVEIAKAMRHEPRILILDEATSSLGDAEVQRLFELVRGLRANGTTVVVITHRMHEVWALADRMTIFRDGRTVAQHGIDEIDQRTAVNLMAGQGRSGDLPAEAAGVRRRAGPGAARRSTAARPEALEPDALPWRDPRPRRPSGSGTAPFPPLAVRRRAWTRRGGSERPSRQLSAIRATRWSTASC